MFKEFPACNTTNEVGSIHYNLLDRVISKLIQVESTGQFKKAQASENFEEAHKPPMLLSISLLLL